MNGNEPEAGASPPRFSIIITFHNQRDFVKDALDSALSLRNAQFEIIAVDDASTDGSQEIMKQYGDAIQLVCFETNQGACAVRDHGASLATGEYLVFLDGDDAFLPWTLDVYERIVKEKQPKMILASMSWFEGALPAVQPGEAPQEIKLVDYRDYLQRDRGFGHSASAMVIARQPFDDVRGWLLSSFPAEDHDLALRLGDAGHTIQILAPSTVLHRSHANNTVNNIPACMSGVGNLLRRERLGDYPGGSRRRLERRALIGGAVIHWTRRALKGGMYGDALRFLVRGWPMVMAAVIRRFVVILNGRQLCETLKL